MMVHLRNQNLPVPSPVETTEGSLFCRCTITDEETQTGTVRLVSLVDHLPGITYNDAGCPSYLLQEIGRLNARTDKALKSFHGTIENESQWKLSKLPEIKDMLLRHCPQSDIQMGLEISSAYKETILPTAEKLQSGIIHGDVNKNNIIVDRINLEDDDSYYISGLVDFADANSSIYVYELAIVMADMMSSIDEMDPLETGRRLFKGYVEVLPLNEEELSVLKLCICIRLLQNYVLRSKSLLDNPGSEYLEQGREESLQLCRYLWQLSDETFTEKKLDGYEDLNIEVTFRKGDNNEHLEAPGREYILKILSLARTGRLKVVDTKADFLVQLLHYIHGVTFLEAGNPLDLLPEVGRLVGRMDTALKNFKEHSVRDTDTLWELTRLPDIASNIPSYCSTRDSRMGQEIVQAHEERIFPKLVSFQKGFIHGDVNNCNIIVKLASEGKESQNTKSYVISGLIDFGDACSSFYVYEIATIMADIMASCFHTTDPIRIAKSLFQGYSQEFALNTDEVNALKLVICIRALQAYVMSGMDAENDPDNKYLTLERQEYIELCRYLWKMDDSNFLAMLVS